MPRRILVLNSVERRIASWGLPDQVLVEVHLQLRQRLPLLPPDEALVRVRWPFDGLVHTFSVANPDDPADERVFIFHIRYPPDEETLIVLAGGDLRNLGF